MKLTLFRGLRDTTPIDADLSWDELGELLSDHEVMPCGASCKGRDCPDKKSGTGWSPVEMKPGTTRSAINVHLVHAAVFDIDHTTMDVVNDLATRLDEAGLATIWHSTHNHRPPTDSCVRVVLALSRPVFAAEWPVLRAALIAKYDIPADQHAKDVSRFFFTPSCPEGNQASRIGLCFPGAAVSVDELLAGKASSGPPSSRRAVLGAPATLDPSAVDFEALRASLRNVSDPENHELVMLMLAHKPIAEEGARDDTVNRLMSVLAFALPVETPTEAVMTLARESLLALPGEGPDGDENWLPKAEYSFERARERRIESDEKKKAFAAQYRRALRHDSAAVTQDPLETVVPQEARPAGNVSTEEAASSDPGAPVPLEPGADEEPEVSEEAQGEPYTAEQLEEWMHAHGVADPKIWEKRWILQTGKTFYVFVNGKYLSPIGRDDLDVSLPRDLSRAPVRLERPAADGTSMRPAKVQELLHDHATVARHIEASLSRQETVYASKTQTIHEAVCPMRDIAVVEHPEIHKWLTLLGGEHSEKLLDWVATVHLLERQTCALYFDLPKGSGKTLFAHGICKLWTMGGPTELANIFAGFNDGLTRCPVLFADEALPDVEGITAELRKIIGSSCRNLSRKFMPSCNLDGCTRVIIGGNNDRLLTTDEDLGTDDLDAVGDRFLYIHPDDSAARYLESLGGPRHVQAWIDADMIAEHQRWLAATRKVDDSNRFLVMGVTSSFHEQLATKTRVGEAITEYLVRILSERAKLSDTIQIGSGQIWVNAECVGESTWHGKIPSIPMPSVSRTGRALNTLAVKRDSSVRVAVPAGGSRRYTFHKLRPEMLLHWAERNHVGDPDIIRERLAQPNPVILASVSTGG